VVELTPVEEPLPLMLDEPLIELPADMPPPVLPAAPPPLCANATPERASTKAAAAAIVVVVFMIAPWVCVIQGNHLAFA
jgi:hypothetical protein